MLFSLILTMTIHRLVFVSLPPQAEEDSLVYSVPDFTQRKSGETARKKEETEEEECYYSEVRPLGLK